MTRTFKVTLYPAKKDNLFISTCFAVFGNYPSRTIEADNLDALLSQVREWANEHAYGCQAYVKPLSKERKWPRFDNLTAKLYFNLNNPNPAFGE